MDERNFAPAIDLVWNVAGIAIIAWLLTINYGIWKDALNQPLLYSAAEQDGTGVVQPFSAITTPTHGR